MAVTAKWYGQAIVGQFSGTAARRVDWANDAIKVMLVKSAYNPAQDTDDFLNDVNANETSGTGYVAGGAELAERTVTYDAATNTTRLDGANVEWKAAEFEAEYAVIYKNTGNAATSPILGFVDFGENVKVAGTFKLEWDATDGVLRGIAAA